MSYNAVNSFVFLNLFQVFLEPSQPRARIVNHWNLWYITPSIFHLSDLKSVLGNSLRITFCRKSPLQSTLEKMQMDPCKTLGIDVWAASTCSKGPINLSISWSHCLTPQDLGWDGVEERVRQKQMWCRRGPPGDFCRIWKFLGSLQWLALLGWHWQTAVFQTGLYTFSLPCCYPFWP